VEKQDAPSREVPEGFTDAILQSDTMDNVDADVLAAVYNPNHPGFINAYMTGAPHKDLALFHSRAHRRNPAVGFTGRSGADQLQRRRNGRRNLVFAGIFTPS